MLVSKSFEAVGVSGELTVDVGKAFDYAVSGTFSATVVLERSDNNGQSWIGLVTATAAASGTIVNETKTSQRYRIRCSVYAEGTVVTTMGDANLDAEKRITNAAGQAKVGTTSGFVVAAGDDIALVTCPASQTAATCVVPISNLKVGERIVAFHLIGQIESAAGEVTVDAELRKHTAAAADVSDASVGAITQLVAVADTIMSKTNTRKSALDEIVGEDETFYVLVTVTTAESTDVALQGVAVEVLPK